MNKKARPLGENDGPKRCTLNPEHFCPEHSKMVRSRAVGTAVLGVAKWAIPMLLLVLTGVIGVLNNDITRVEAKFDDAMVRNEEIYRSVQAIDMNLIFLMGELGVDYVEPHDLP